MSVVKLNFLCILIFFMTGAYAQAIKITGYAEKVTIRGIVVDSLSLASLPGVTIKIKRTGQGVLSSTNGSFSIQATSIDTLVFTSVGYRKFEYALFEDEDEVLIRLKENYILLKEVTTRATTLETTAVKEHPIVTPSLAEGIFSPFTYFSRTEREKRNLIKLREENKRLKTYVQIVNDPDLKEEFMEKYVLREKDYYELLAKFNQQNRQAAYLSNEEEIKRLLNAFFTINSRLR
jgi:hypothetical protein